MGSFKASKESVVDILTIWSYAVSSHDIHSCACNSISIEDGWLIHSQMIEEIIINIISLCKSTSVSQDLGLKLINFCSLSSICSCISVIRTQGLKLGKFIGLCLKLSMQTTEASAKQLVVCLTVSSYTCQTSSIATLISWSTECMDRASLVCYRITSTPADIVTKETNSWAALISIEARVKSTAIS